MRVDLPCPVIIVDPPPPLFSSLVPASPIQSDTSLDRPICPKRLLSFLLDQLQCGLFKLRVRWWAVYHTK